MTWVRVTFCGALSGVTAFEFCNWLGAHEGPFQCHGPASMCSPDELPGVTFLILFPLLWALADKLTRGR